MPTSRRNVRSSRGENWVEAICRVTTVRANTRLVTGMSAPMMTVMTWRASLALPWKAIGPRNPGPEVRTFPTTVPMTRPTRTASAGLNHSARRISFADRVRKTTVWVRVLRLRTTLVTWVRSTRSG